MIPQSLKSTISVQKYKVLFTHPSIQSALQIKTSARGERGERSRIVGRESDKNVTNPNQQKQQGRQENRREKCENSNPFTTASVGHRLPKKKARAPISVVASAPGRNEKKAGRFSEQLGFRRKARLSLSDVGWSISYAARPCLARAEKAPTLAARARPRTKPSASQTRIASGGTVLRFPRARSRSVLSLREWVGSGSCQIDRGGGVSGLSYPLTPSSPSLFPAVPTG